MYLSTFKNYFNLWLKTDGLSSPPIGKEETFYKLLWRGSKASLPSCQCTCLTYWTIDTDARGGEGERTRGDNTLLTQYKIYEKSHKFMWPAFFKLGLKLNWAIWKSFHSQDS